MSTICSTHSCSSYNNHNWTSANQRRGNNMSESKSTSFFGSLKVKFSRDRSSSRSEARERISRADVGQSDTKSSSWKDNTPAPAETPQQSSSDAPPAYTASVNLSANFPARRGASPTPSLASITSAEDKYAFLSTFDTVFVIDDSGSMAGSSWHEVRDVLAAIAPICTARDPDGIDVFFLNHKSHERGSDNKASGGYTNIRDAAQVQRLFERIKPSAATPTGNRLQSILRPYVADLASNKNNMERVKPMNIIVITDGRPTDDPESIIVHHARKLDQLEAPPHQVGIQFFQVGSEPGATRALRELDDDLASFGIRDMVDTVSWDVTKSGRNSKALTADGILKVVLGAVVRRLDRRSIDGSIQHSRR